MSKRSPAPFARSRCSALALVAALAGSAAAQDSPGGPGKGDAPAAPPAGKADPPAKAPPPAKKERKVDPKAVEAIERYRKMLHLPANAGVKKLVSRGELALPMLPEPVVVRPRWTAADGFGFDVEIPDSLKEQFGPEGVAMMQKQFGGFVALLVEPLFADVGRDAAAYDLAVQPVKDDPAAVAVVLTPFDDEKARHERQKFVFGADGLLRTSTTTPKIAADDPAAAMLAGVDIEMTVEHEKRGDRWVTKGFTALLPTGEVRASIGGFWDGPGGLPLPKSIELVLPMSQEPIRVDLHDYAVDDKPVEGTAKPKAEAPKPGDPKPAEPKAAEPTEPKKDAPPAPKDPAPKDAPPK